MLEVRELPGWLSFSQAAPLLGLRSGQGVHHMVFNQRAFDPADISFVNLPHQPLYLLRRRAVIRLRRLRAEAAEQAENERAAAAAHAELVATRRQLRARLGEPTSGRLKPESLAHMAEVLGTPAKRWTDYDLDELRTALERLRPSSTGYSYRVTR